VGGRWEKRGRGHRNLTAFRKPKRSEDRGKRRLPMDREWYDGSGGKEEGKVTNRSEVKRLQEDDKKKGK